MTDTPTVDLPDAARRLGLTWRQCYDLVLAGTLRGEKTARGRWRIQLEDVERLLRERTEPSPTT